MKPYLREDHFSGGRPTGTGGGTGAITGGILVSSGGSGGTGGTGGSGGTGGLTLREGTASDITFVANAISGDGTLSKDGSGTIVLTGTNTYTGTTTVFAGALFVNGSNLNSATTVNDTATLSGIGRTGDVTVLRGGTISGGFTSADQSSLLNTDNLSLQAGSTLAENIGGRQAGTGYDLIDVTGTVQLDGAALSLRFFNGFTSSAGDTFVLINNGGSGAISGAGGTGSPSLIYNGSPLTEGDELRCLQPHLSDQLSGSDRPGQFTKRCDDDRRDGSRNPPLRTQRLPARLPATTT